VCFRRIESRVGRRDAGLRARWARGVPCDETRKSEAARAVHALRAAFPAFAARENRLLCSAA
jgi:hypothetical protein